MRPHIIGKGGSRVQELEKDTLTKIKIPQQSTSETPVGDYEDEMMIDVVIEGDEFGVTSAIARIREIVGERVSSSCPLTSRKANEGFRLSPRLPVSLMFRANSTHSSRDRTVITLKSSRRKLTRFLYRTTFSPKRASLSVLLPAPS